ncbi:MAG: hypothetical protein JO309_05400 [Pseudonocardiales bacterium]|nr:hypothetical protein [Pseudonocardiales bacterium]MBV9728834.1 hypothetical protein [Pseudonocardiales bacterium]
MPIVINATIGARTHDILATYIQRAGGDAGGDWGVTAAPSLVPITMLWPGEHHIRALI